ncbi:MAG: SpaH/EbpB family LPXTG-anchored major pilin [Oscillospiraceae bacterium]|nr:SpaH/EbpB family LPXTG-anchored major pilin [Oscillospiraceae bacterium]
MLKTTKKVMAILLAAMFMLAMIPFSASAATDNVNFTVKCEKTGFTFTVYQLATLDTTTGTYDVKATDEDVVDAFQTVPTNASDNTVAKAVLAAAEGADLSKLGTALPETYTSGSGTKDYTVAPGVYYIKPTTTPAGTKKAAGSIVALPYYNGTTSTWVDTYATIDLAGKVDASPVSLTKVIEDGKDNGDTWTTAGLGGTVNFKLTSDITGSATTPLTTYVFKDIMAEGLTFDGDSSVTVTLKGDSASETLGKANYEVKTNVTEDSDTYTFTVSINSAYLAGAEFYNYKTVEVTYSATLNDKAKLNSNENINKAKLTYGSGSSTSSTNWSQVTVYTYGLQVEKVDANNENTKLEGAVFQVTKQGESIVLATATTGADGIGVFMNDGKAYQFDAGTYTITETTAPTGYNKNTEAIEVTIEASKTLATTYQQVRITNTPALLPETGGNGTMLFTIIGGALVLCAGAMYILVFRKRTSK